MPEGDTIWRAARGLRVALQDRRVAAARPAALARLSGRALRGVETAGKHLYMRFDDGIVLHTHMRMTGAWHVYGPGERWRRAAHLATAVLDFEGNVQAVLFAAPVCELVTAAAIGAGLGPDILAADFDIDPVLSRIRTSGVPTIAEVLLDQGVCAGIGNIHRCNALWHERVDPLTPPLALDDAAVRRIYARARDLLRRGAVADRFRSQGGVHGRAGRGCAVCGSTIQARPLGRPSRILFWCPGCQPAATQAVSRAAAPTG
jgi:endonuclease-8